MLIAPSMLGLIRPKTAAPVGSLLELNNPNAFNVIVGLAGQNVKNTHSVGTGTISSPGVNAGGNTGITFF